MYSRRCDTTFLIGWALDAELFMSTQVCLRSLKKYSTELTLHSQATHVETTVAAIEFISWARMLLHVPRSLLQHCGRSVLSPLVEQLLGCAWLYWAPVHSCNTNPQPDITSCHRLLSSSLAALSQPRCYWPPKRPSGIDPQPAVTAC